MSIVIYFLVFLFIYLIIGALFLLHFIKKNARTEEDFNEMIKDIGWRGYFTSIFIALLLWPYVIWVKFNMSQRVNQRIEEFQQEL